jgi:hypothetical protein
VSTSQVVCAGVGNVELHTTAALPERRIWWLTEASALCLLSIGFRSGVEAHRVDALRAAPNTESGRSVAFNICSRNRPAQCKPVQTDVEAVG